MRVVLKDGLIVIVPETEQDAVQIETWKSASQDHVFHLRPSDDTALQFYDLGERAEACRVPINVVSNSPDPIARMISNFAPTPFLLDGRSYQSVESFWQGLKFSSDRDRSRIAQLDGARARSEGEAQGYGATVAYSGQSIPVGTWQHWRLMEVACRAKFEQNFEAAEALMSTGDRPLIHVVRRDSKSIPGVIMAAIWMQIRHEVRSKRSGNAPR